MEAEKRSGEIDETRDEEQGKSAREKAKQYALPATQAHPRFVLSIARHIRRPQAEKGKLADCSKTDGGF